MLLPALNKARERARSSLCQGNQKQIGLGFQLYIDDNDGSFVPYYSAPPTGEYSRWTSILVKHYGISGGVFICPTRPDWMISGVSINGQWKQAKKYSEVVTNYFWDMPCYGYNAFFLARTQWSSDKNPAKISKIKTPATMVLAAESVSSDRHTAETEFRRSRFVYPAYNTGYHCAKPIHENISQTVRVDGHVVPAVSPAKMGEAGIRGLYQADVLGAYTLDGNQWTADGKIWTL